MIQIVWTIPDIVSWFPVWLCCMYVSSVCSYCLLACIWTIMSW